MKKPYLLFYNSVCGAGWGFCAARAAALLVAGAGAKDLYKEIGQTLAIVQTAMLLEVVHSLLGIVPSPVFTVFIQVMSRIFILWGQLYWVPACQAHWSLFMMIISWGITETVRYSFYFTALLGTVPYPLFYLRYSLFIVLYPTGITGEILQTFVGMTYWQTANPLWFRLSILVLLIYVPGSPGMIANMWGNRKRSLAKRASESTPKVEPEGVVWPKDKKGERSSTAVNQSIIAAAARAGPGGEAAAAKVTKEKKWRFKYNKHLLEHVSQSLESEAACIAMARAGLAAAQETFQFRRDKKEMPVKSAMEQFREDVFETAEFKGSKALPSKPELTLMYGGPTAGQPYYNFKGQRKTIIRGATLTKQLDAWAEYGTIEPDVAEALKLVQENQQEWLNLSGKYFVLLGAGSAMGPLKFLLGLGATVVVVAQPNTLKRIIGETKETPGTILFPVKKGTDWRSMLKAGDMSSLSCLSGCNLLTQAPEIAAWLTSVAPGKPLAIGNYTYLDGARHVQIAVACDCIMESLCNARSDTAVAFLGTPTDAHVVPKEAAAAAAKAYREAPFWMKLWEGMGVLKQNKAIAVRELQFEDAIVPDQGPNYILAKRLQHWRAVVARADGHTASSNVAPSAATASVTSNASFAAAYGGMHMFKPMEVIFEELALTAMSALLIYDLQHPASAARASTKLPHPLCLFERTSFHGGIWRCPYSIDTIGIPSAVRYYLTVFWAHILLGVASLAVLAQYTAFGTLPMPVVTLLSAVPAAPLMALADALSIPV